MLALTHSLTHSLPGHTEGILAKHPQQFPVEQQNIKKINKQWHILHLLEQSRILTSYTHKVDVSLLQRQISFQCSMLTPQIRQEMKHHGGIATIFLPSNLSNPLLVRLLLPALQNLWSVATSPNNTRKKSCCTCVRASMVYTGRLNEVQFCFCFLPHQKWVPPFWLVWVYFTSLCQ